MSWLLFVAVFFSAVSGAHASQGEFELFDRGYEYYLAYQPEKATEAFRTFLSDYPESSAKDGAIFWLAKSLIQTGSVEEAKKVFSELKQQCPESPFIPFAEREMEALRNPEGRQRTEIRNNERAPETVKREPVGEGGLREAEKKIVLLDAQLTKTVGERDRLGVLLEKEKKRAEEMQATIAGLEKKEAELRASKGSVEPVSGDAGGKKTGRQDLESRVKAEAPVIVMGDRRYSAGQIGDFMMNSSAAMTRMGVREVPWRNGILIDDFINEEILSDEAKRQNISVDAKKEEDLARKFGLTAKETEYLGRYLAISDLIDRKIRTMPDTRVVESLTVRYTEKDRQDKIELANELQSQAKAGKSFEEIARKFPDKTQLSTVGFDELQGWIKERIELLHDGEISVVWTKDGYMILKPVMRNAAYKPFEDISPGRKDEIRAFVKEWIDGLKKGIRISVEKSG